MENHYKALFLHHTAPRLIIDHIYDVLVFSKLYIDPKNLRTPAKTTFGWAQHNASIEAIHEAYYILSNPARRAAYDQALSNQQDIEFTQLFKNTNRQLCNQQRISSHDRPPSLTYSLDDIVQNTCPPRSPQAVIPRSRGFSPLVLSRFTVDPTPDKKALFDLIDRLLFHDINRPEIGEMSFKALDFMIEIWTAFAEASSAKRGLCLAQASLYKLRSVLKREEEQNWDAQRRYRAGERKEKRERDGREKKMKVQQGRQKQKEKREARLEEDKQVESRQTNEQDENTQQAEAKDDHDGVVSSNPTITLELVSHQPVATLQSQNGAAMDHQTLQILSSPTPVLHNPPTKPAKPTRKNNISKSKPPPHISKSHNSKPTTTISVKSHLTPHLNALPPPPYKKNLSKHNASAAKLQKEPCSWKNRLLRDWTGRRWGRGKRWLRRGRGRGF